MLLVECKLVQPLWRTVWRFLKKLERELPSDPAIPLLGIHNEETRIERDTCTPMFITALFIIARTWKQPRCPSADEWIRKLWYSFSYLEPVCCSMSSSNCCFLTCIWSTINEVMQISDTLWIKDQVTSRTKNLDIPYFCWKKSKCSFKKKEKKYWLQSQHQRQ